MSCSKVIMAGKDEEATKGSIGLMFLLALSFLILFKSRHDCEGLYFSIISDTIEFDELQTSVSSGSVLVVDVRNRTDYNSEGSIPSSVNIPLHEVYDGAFLLPNYEFRRKYGIDKPGKNVKIIVSCYTGSLASLGSYYLSNLGYSKSRAYQGSFNDWVSNGGSVIQGMFFPI